MLRRDRQFYVDSVAIIKGVIGGESRVDTQTEPPYTRNG